MRTLISIAVGFWIAREISSRYHKRLCTQIQLKQKRRLQAYFKDQGFSQRQIKEYTKSILNL
ncbi:hypothetical protein U8527_06925 [Kordia algicida OT-1]|uniref:Uncharacterized protein n=1 Tax=Kordia algicida OT-1 TaxID=391587 RepID=A9E9H6_9FLAO|nr:hypothetical protein [Kordia algicida]EDP94673.1 hypothetical protein KAOT1_00315 [Kordia algicida OT-1]